MEINFETKRVPKITTVLFSVFAVFLLMISFMNIAQLLFANRFFVSLNPKELVPYKHVDFPLLIDRPGGWELNEKKRTQINGRDCFAQFYGADPKVCLHFSPVLNGIHIGNYWPELYIESFPNVNLITHERAVINEKTFTEYNFTYKIKHIFSIFGTEYRCRLYYVVENDGDYMFMYCAHKVNYNKFLPLFEEIMQSVRFEEAK